jgi:hypothetical protein
MKTTECDFSKLIEQADEVFDFAKGLSGTMKQKYQAVQQYTFKRRSEDKEFLYLCTSGVTEGRDGWILFGNPISTQKEMKSFFNKISEIGHSLIGLTYYFTVYEKGGFNIEIVTRDKVNEKIVKTVVYFKSCP